MRFQTFGFIWLLLLANHAPTLGQEFRQWNTQRGQSTRVKLAAVEFVGEVVRFRREDDGREFTFPVSRLSDEDQVRIHEMFREANATHGHGADVTSDPRWPEPIITSENLYEWADFLWPSEQELRWRDVRWHNNLGSAVLEARRLDRPILLWTMNGNPCGET